MPKRGNDNAQLSKEEYDALGSSGDDGGGTFKRASASAMAKRKIFSAKKRAKVRSPSTSPVPPAATGATGTGGGSNPFAGFSFGAPAPAPAGATSKSVGFSFTPNSAASPAPPDSSGFSFSATPAATSKPTSNAGHTPFVFGGASSSTSSATTPAPGGFSFATNTSTTGTNNPFSFSAPAPAATGGFSFPTASTTTNTASGTGGGSSKNKLLQERFQRHAISLEEGFYKECQTLPLTHTNLLPLLDNYLDAVYVLESEYWKRVEKEDDEPAPTAKASVATGSTGGFTFGAAPAAAAAPAPAAAGGGLFGAPPAPAAPAPAAAAPVAEDGDAMPSEPTIQAEPAADQDYETLATLGGKNSVHFYVDKKKVTSGIPKIQLHKTTQKLRIVMRNDASGKVLVNMGLQFGGAKYVTQTTKRGSIENVYLIGKLTEEQEEPKMIILRTRVDANSQSMQDTLTQIQRDHAQ